MSASLKDVSNKEFQEEIKPLDQGSEVENKTNETGLSQIENNKEQNKQAEEKKIEKPVEDLSKKETAKNMSCCELFEKFFWFLK